MRGEIVSISSTYCLQLSAKVCMSCGFGIFLIRSEKQEVNRKTSFQHNVLFFLYFVLFSCCRTSFVLIL